MKKLTLSVIAVITMGTFAVAGGDIKNVEPAVEPVAEVIVNDDSSFYVGGGYSYIRWRDEQSNDDDIDIDGDAFMLLAGYNFNKYIAVEGRYSKTVGDLSWEISDYEFDTEDTFSNIALYLKPMYPVGGLTLYGLLGYGKVTFDFMDEDYSESGFQWGLGTSYAVTDNLGVFIDYTRLYDDTDFDSIGADDLVIDSINVGFTYKF